MAIDYNYKVLWLQEISILAPTSSFEHSTTTTYTGPGLKLAARASDSASSIRRFLRCLSHDLKIKNPKHARTNSNSDFGRPSKMARHEMSSTAAQDQEQDANVQASVNLQPPIDSHAPEQQDSQDNDLAVTVRGRTYSHGFRDRQLHAIIFARPYKDHSYVKQLKSIRRQIVHNRGDVYVREIVGGCSYRNKSTAWCRCTVPPGGAGTNGFGLRNWRATFISSTS
jgi:hypothetical protein